MRTGTPSVAGGLTAVASSEAEGVFSTTAPTTPFRCLTPSDSATSGFESLTFDSADDFAVTPDTTDGATSGSPLVSEMGDSAEPPMLSVWGDE